MLLSGSMPARRLDTRPRGSEDDDQREVRPDRCIQRSASSSACVRYACVRYAFGGLQDGKRLRANRTTACAAGLSAEPVQEREGKMIPSNGIKPVYDPDTLRIMADAFDRACRFLPVQFKNNERLRRKLALHIIRHLNEGESDPTRLADSAILFVRR
jgi:hypothetical protein